MVTLQPLYVFTKAEEVFRSSVLTENQWELCVRPSGDMLHLSACFEIMLSIIDDDGP